MDEELKRRLDRIDKKLTLLLQASKKETSTWVKVSVIVEVTGWDTNKLRRMRECGIIQYKREARGFWYLLESIPPMFLKLNTGSVVDERKEM